MNRVDAYGAIKRLVDAGLVEQEVKSHGRKIHPQPLDASSPCGESPKTSRASAMENRKPHPQSSALYRNQ